MSIQLSQTSKVLIVDDEPHILTAIEFLLKRNHFAIEKANDGREALDIMPHFKPDIVILDVMMPGMDGFEVARQIRNTPLYEDVRIVFLTAKGTDKDRWTGYASGAEVYLTKPFDNTTLIETVSEMMKFS